MRPKARGLAQQVEECDPPDDFVRDGRSMPPALMYCTAWHALMYCTAFSALPSGCSAVSSWQIQLLQLLVCY